MGLTTQQAVSISVCGFMVWLGLSSPGWEVWGAVAVGFQGQSLCSRRLSKSPCPGGNYHPPDVTLTFPSGEESPPGEAGDYLLELSALLLHKAISIALADLKPTV